MLNALFIFYRIHLMLNQKLLNKLPAVKEELALKPEYFLS